MALSASTWLARLWQEAAQIFDKWSVEGAKAEHDGPVQEHPDVVAVAAHLAETAPAEITADAETIAEHVAKVVAGMQHHAEILLNKPADEFDPDNETDAKEPGGSEKPPVADDNGKSGDGTADPPPSAPDPENETDPGKDQPKGKKGKS